MLIKLELIQIYKIFAKIGVIQSYKRVIGGQQIGGELKYRRLEVWVGDGLGLRKKLPPAKRHPAIKGPDVLDKQPPLPQTSAQTSSEAGTEAEVRRSVLVSLSLFYLPLPSPTFPFVPTPSFIRSSSPTPACLPAGASNCRTVRFLSFQFQSGAMLWFAFS